MFDVTNPVLSTNEILTVHNSIKLVPGRGGKALCNGIAKELGIRVSEPEIQVFSNENIFVRLKESVRGQDVYVVQCLSTDDKRIPVHDLIMEMFIIIDALKRSSAGRITLVIPYLPYSRSDKRDQPRISIAGKLMADLIQTAGANRYITYDLHSPQMQGFFSIPGDAIPALGLLSDYVKSLNIPDLVACSADLGSVKRARNWSRKLGSKLAVVEKDRIFNTEQTKAMQVIGDVRDKNVILVDDEVLTGGTLVQACAVLRESGARDIYVAFTHAILKGSGIENLVKLGAKEIITTDSFPHPAGSLPDNVTILSIAPTLAEVIRRSHFGIGVGEFLKDVDDKLGN